ncbi:MAG: thioredoxin [Planctomycetes bacterium]|nr:thioredoxin [Planctomycetota bacterium]
MLSKATELTDLTFKDAVAAGVSLVDFWAPWCPPCRIQGPIIEKLAEIYAGKAMVAKINVDAEANSAAEYNVSSIPTLILFKDGGEVNRFVGVRQESELIQALDALLK